MTELTIAAFITPHGYGHAARACAVLNALRQDLPGLQIELFTQVPVWFFQDSLGENFTYHALESDIGMSQRSPLEEDLAGTLARLAAFLPFHPDRVKALANQIIERNCRLVLCDVAALGLVVARAAGLPGVLLENFTWDWIYQAYLPQAPALAGPIAYLRNQYKQADIHIQAEPVCNPSPHADFISAPISRTPRRSRTEIRSRLGIPDAAKAVLVTMGGITAGGKDWGSLPGDREFYWVIPGGADVIERKGNRILLPHHSSFYHPDLVHACDAVLGKAGYSTLAEAYQAGVPFVYFSRPNFPEAQVLANFIQVNMQGFEITESDLCQSTWLDRLSRLIGQPSLVQTRQNGAVMTAKYLEGLM